KNGSLRQKRSRRHQRASRQVYPWHVLWRMIQTYTHRLKVVLCSVWETIVILVWIVMLWIRAIIFWPWRERHLIWNKCESWVDTGVSSGLFSPGTLVGVALLIMVVWGGGLWTGSDMGSK